MDSSQTQLPVNELQAKLAADYQRLADQYVDARRVALDVHDAFTHKTDSTDSIDRLRESMDGIRSTEDSIRPYRNQWDTLGLKADVQLRAAVDRLTETIKSMMAPIHEAEELAIAAKEGKVPQLGRAMASRQMVAAYGSAKQNIR